MHGDPDAIRALARTMHEQGEEVRAECRRLRALLGAVAWTGLAADTATDRAIARLGDLAVAADRHEDASDALSRHAALVEERLALIARAERFVAELLADGAGHLGDLVLPATGSREWLDVDLGSLAAALGAAS